MTNMILDQGATWRRGWIVTDAGNLVDLTGAHGRFQVRLGSTEGEAIVDLDDVDRGGLALGGTSGTIDVEVTDALSSAIVITGAIQASLSEVQNDGGTHTATGALCYWGIEATMPSGDVLRLGGGRMIITREVVR